MIFSVFGFLPCAVIATEDFPFVGIFFYIFFLLFLCKRKSESGIFIKCVRVDELVVGPFFCVIFFFSSRLENRLQSFYTLSHQPKDSATKAKKKENILNKRRKWGENVPVSAVFAWNEKHFFKSHLCLSIFFSLSINILSHSEDRKKITRQRWRWHLQVLCMWKETQQKRRQ